MKKISSSATSIALAVGLVVALGGGVAMAKGHGPGKHHGPPAFSSEYGYGYGYGGNSHKPVGKVATGSTTCNIRGIAVISASGSVSIKGNLTPSHRSACTYSGGTKLRTGHLSQPLTFTSSSTSSSTSCPPLPSGALPVLAGGNITWSPGPKVAATVGISFPAGNATVDSTQHLQISYAGGSVASGSFTNTGGTALTLTSNQTVTQLQGKCESGKTVIAFHGSITL